MEYYSASKSTVLTPAATRTDLGDIVLSETSQTRCVRLCLCGAEGRQAHRDRERGGGQAPGEVDTGLSLGGDRVSDSGGQEAPETACLTTWTYLTTAELYTERR